MCSSLFVREFTEFQMQVLQLHYTDPTVRLNCELNSNVAETADDQNLVSNSRSSYFETVATDEGILIFCNKLLAVFRKLHALLDLILECTNLVQTVRAYYT